MITGDETGAIPCDRDGHGEAAVAFDDAPARSVVAASQRFLNCSRCGLTIQVRFTWLRPEHCPRCLARARVAHPMFQSPLPFSQLTAGQPAVQQANGHRCGRADGDHNRAV